MSSRTLVAHASTDAAINNTYDIAGREIQSTEPSGSAITSPATSTHNYYADGKLKSLDVQSSALTQAGLFVYSYGADGALVQYQINDAGNPLVGNTALTYTHDAAGRMLSESDSKPVCWGPNPPPFPNTIIWNGGTVTPQSLTPGTATGVGLGNLVGMPRTDGITDQYTTIQGVRSYDPQLGSWTSPDAYALDDPSGYDFSYIDPSLNGTLDWLKRESIPLASFFNDLANDKNWNFNVVLVKSINCDKCEGKIQAHLVNGRWGGKTMDVLILANNTRPGTAAALAHELAGHGHDLLTKGLAKYISDAHSHGECRNPKNCDNEEADAQLVENIVLMQMGLTFDNGYDVKNNPFSNANLEGNRGAVTDYVAGLNPS